MPKSFPVLLHSFCSKVLLKPRHHRRDGLNKTVTAVLLRHLSNSALSLKTLPSWLLEEPGQCKVEQDSKNKPSGSVWIQSTF